MRPEDFGRFLEAAFEKVEPVDNAQRQKLEKLRDKIRTINEETALEVAKVQAEVAQLAKPVDDDEVRQSAHRKEELATEILEAMRTEFEIQSELIERIARRSN